MVSWRADNVPRRRRDDRPGRLSRSPRRRTAPQKDEKKDGGAVLSRSCRPRSGGVVTDGYIDAYLELKMQEVTRFRMTTPPVEFDMYYRL